MKTSLNAFFRRTGKRTHEKLMVHINWDSMSQEDIRTLAAFYVLHRVEEDLKGWEEKLPESIEFRAADYIHRQPMSEREFNIPEAWKAPPESKALKEARKVFAGLSAETIRKLLKEV